MTKATRQVMAGMVMTALAVVGRPAVAAGQAPAMPRVRSSSGSIAALIARATEQSETFRRLIEAIDASDGIVYVEEGRCGHSMRACFVAVSTAGANRMLRVKVDTRAADWDLMGSIGHELRHAIEVLGNRTVVNNGSMYLFYDQLGSRGAGGAFETQAATNTGHAVRAEVRKFQARATAN